MKLITGLKNVRQKWTDNYSRMLSAEQELKRQKEGFVRFKIQSRKSLDAAERKISYLEELVETLRFDCRKLDKEKSDVAEQLETSRARHASLKKEIKELNDRLRHERAGAAKADNWAAQSNSLEKGQLIRSKIREEDIDNSSNWLLSYSDFMTLLMAVFVVFFSISSTDSERLRKVTSSIAETFKGSKKAGLHEQDDPVRAFADLPGIKSSMTNPHELDTLKQEILRSFEDYNLGESLLVAVKNKGVEITLREGITFVAGDSALLGTSTELLDRLSGIIADNYKYDVVVEGHTDDRPISTERFPSNWELSTSRATAVVRYFIEEKGLDRERFSAKGYAEYSPVADNSTEAGRAANRRVVIKLVTRK